MSDNVKGPYERQGVYGPGNPPPEFDGCCASPVRGAHLPSCSVFDAHPLRDLGWGKPYQPESLADQLDLDLLLWGNAYLVDGKRVDPTTVRVRHRTPQGGAEQVHPKIHSQEEFLTALDVLLDHTLHADECYIDDAQTECVCVIGKVRAVLPPCGAVRGVAPVYKCTRNAHPASPNRHTFG